MAHKELAAKASALKDVKVGASIMGQFWEDAYNNAKAKGLEEGIAEGRAEGLAEGRAEGLAEGLAEGRAEGRAEGQAEGIASAVKSLAANLGLSVDDALKAVNAPENLWDEIKAAVSKQ